VHDRFYRICPREDFVNLLKEGSGVVRLISVLGAGLSTARNFDGLFRPSDHFDEGWGINTLTGVENNFRLGESYGYYTN